MPRNLSSVFGRSRLRWKAPSCIERSHRGDAALTLEAQHQCMTALTQPLEISVLAAPLAAIDRRALSQAWYSALGYAGARRVGRVPGPERASFSRPLASRVVRSAALGLCAAPAVHGSAAHSHAARTTRARACAPNGGSAPAPTRHKRLSSISTLRNDRQIVRSRGFARTTVKLEDGGGRVHLMLQSSGGVLRLIAVCKSQSRARVARALEEVLYALSLRGTAMEADVQEGASCT
jgi:hypothetical protein